METPSLFLKDPSAVTLVAGDLEAVFLPRYGMLGASLRHRHIEILRRVQDLEVAAAKGSTAGIPLLHPWANRLAGPRYRTAGGRWCSIHRRHSSTSTSTGFQCTACGGPCSPGS